jgi:hypothetical protein
LADKEAMDAEAVLEQLGQALKLQYRSALEYTPLIEHEQATIDELQDVIPNTGKDGPSEAIEHLMEHLILRKQNQVDFLVRASRDGGG